MTQIVIIGEENDTALEKLIREELSKTYRIIYIKDREITEAGAGYELVCFDSPRPVIGISEAVIVAKRSAVLSGIVLRGGTVIINADKPSQVEAVRDSGSPAVDCGFSPAATVSFTGENEDTLVISLNRSVTALSGKVIQPFEIPAAKHGADAYTLMSFTALRLLLDDRESELGQLI